MASPGDRFDVIVEGERRILTRLEPARPVFSKGKLSRDARTGLLKWTGDVGEDDADAVIRNRAHDKCKLFSMPAFWFRS